MGEAVRVVVVVVGMLMLAGCQGRWAPENYKSASAMLFDAPHRTADSLWTMPEAGAAGPALASALDGLFSGDLAGARRHAARAGYRIDEKSDGGRDYFILSERDGAGIGPIVAVARQPVRDAIIEAPHPVIDRGTDKEAVVLFQRLGARALILSGANRCAAKNDTPCSGATGVCGDGRNRYRASDPAHNSATLFHAVHLYFTRRWPRSIAVQPHGFSNGGSSVWFVISDGSGERRPGDAGLTGRVRDRIHARLGRRDRAVSCQDPKDRKIQTRWLCATSTVQGRDLNGSPDACRVAAQKSSGRFLHIEQVYGLVRRAYAKDLENLQNHPGSIAILKALEAELPCIRGDCRPAAFAGR
jgi:hypothetical protein